MTLKRTLLGALALVVSAGGLATAAQAQTVGTCSGGAASTDLDINNVRARIFNNGGLFWKGAGNVYNVPKAPTGTPITPNAVFAGGIWLGGLVGTELRGVAAQYGNWELWPGPLGADGNLLNPNCSVYDRIFLVSREQLRQYVFSGTTTTDLTAWPTGLGAPTFVDANRNAVRDASEAVVVPTSRTQLINLQANQLPFLTGDQMAWWIMNDVGAAKRTTNTKPLGLEVQVSAFSFAREGALGNTTFYRYKLAYKGSQPLTQAYFGIWSDPDLGNATDDYVGSIPNQGLGYVYNADNNDEGSDGYGSPPPALGYDFFQGPLIDAPGKSFTDPDGTVSQNKTRLPATGFMYYDNNSSNHGNPRGGTDDFYKYLKSTWQNGTPILNCGNGDDTAQGKGCTPEPFMYSGNPVTKQGWSEFNIFPGSGAPVANAPNDRRFLVSTGPFTINPGDEQTIVYGIVWARGGTNLGSVTALGRADNQAQLAFDNNFILPDPPAAPRVNKAEQNQEVILSWFYEPTDNNFQNSYRAPLSVAGQQTFYQFEGFNIYRYPNEAFNPEEGELIATYDRINGVTQIIEDNDLGTTSITANGSDNGLQYSIREGGLTNYKKYYYGVQAYAYNGSTPVEKILRSQVTRVTATPQPTTARNGGTQDVTGNAGREITGTGSASTKGQGVIFARVLDPTRITGDSYRLNFFRTAIAPGDTVLTYDIVNATKGTKVFDGRAYSIRTKMGAPQNAEGVPGAPAEVAQADGLSFFVGGPAAEVKDFVTTRNAAGPITPTEIGAFAFNGSGFPHSSAGDRPTARQQSTVNLAGTAGWGIHTFGARTLYAEWLSRTTRDGGNNPVIFPNDYEWRFTGSSLAERAFDTDAATVGATMTVPFEIWSIGADPASAADDVRMIPLVCETACGAGTAPGVFDIGGDSPLSGGVDDPITDAVYWYFPVNRTPGQAGYNAYFNGGTPNDAAIGPEAWARMVIMGWNMGTTPATYRMPRPETGTVFRISTTKPNQPGDVYTIATANVSARVGVDSLFQASIDRIGISPNPYRGASNYETSNLQDAARFTGLPERATIRIFTLSGTLIRTLSKSGPDRFLEWDLQTETALPIASGMYLIHVDVLDSDGKSIGEKVIKFGVVKKRIQLDLL